MTLSAGDKLGPYEILSLIGAGGMGEVWKANDTRLHRTVAIKISKEEFSERFEREARAIAALNHPGICTLFDVGKDYLVMEMIEGPTLAERIAQGRIPLDQAVVIARQLAEALEAAHEKGIVHRDLKPANVKLTPEGNVKVLDFGLAKAACSEAALGPGDQTLTASATQAGSIIGTAAYMSPEQARGQTADKRADIWALGVVFYEMTAGTRPFGGASTTDLVAAVITKEPDWGRVPQRVRRLIQRCLEKDPKQRLRDIGEVRIALNEADNPDAAPQRGSKLPSLWIAATVFAVAAALMTWKSFHVSSHPMNAVVLSLNPPPGVNYTEFGFALSQDGRNLAFIAGTDARQSIWVRSMDSLVARDVPGTEGAIYPFWSPDSKSLGFFSVGKLNRVEVAGGAPRTICDAVNSRGGSWGADGMIVFAPGAGGGLKKVSSGGGKPESVTSLDAGRKETEHRWPRFLPGGKRFLYWVQSVNAEDTGVYVGSVDNAAQPVRIVTSERLAEYAPDPNGNSGFLLWVRGTTLLAQRFDPGRLTMEGEPAPISDGVAISGLGLAHFTVSGIGILISGSTSLGRRRMQWRSRDGKVMGDIGPADTYYSPRLSPDGRRLAVARVSTAVNSDVWVYEFERGIMTRLTIAPGVDNYPAWSPDGRFVAFTTARGGPRSLFLTDAAGDRREERLTNGTFNHELLDWSSDNRYLLYREYNPVSHSDLYLLNMKSSPTGREALPFLATPFDEIQGQFSPDAKWVVYISNETGDFQLYVRPVSKGEPMPVSSQGATNPRWRRDGKEIFFISPSGMLMGVDVVEVDGRLRFSAPRELFPIPHRPGQSTIDYDVTADGKRFLLLAPAAESAAAALTVSLNWQSGLKK